MKKLSRPEWDYAVLKPCGCCIAIGLSSSLTKALRTQYESQGYKIKIVTRQQASEMHLSYVKNGCSHGSSGD